MLRLGIVGTAFVSVGIVCCAPKLSGDGAKSALESSPLNPGRTQCSAAWRQTEINLMGWDGNSRAALGTAHRNGGVVVRYGVRYVGDACSIELEVLRNCFVRTRYEFAPSQLSNHITVHDSDELYTALPLGAVHLGGEVQDEKAIRLDYMLSGIDSLPPGAEFHKEHLQGSGCERATHVVSRVYVGGFSKAVGESTVIDAAVGIFGAKAGGKSESRSLSVQTEGSASACDAAHRTGQPTNGCDVPLEVGLVPIADVEREPCQDVNACTVQCKGGDAFSCNLLGVMYFEGKGVKKNVVEASRLFELACSANYASGCVSLGHLCDAGEGVPRDPLRAAGLYERACAGGDPYGCMDLAIKHEKGNGVEQDYDRARALFSQACLNGLPVGCSRAIPYLDGDCKRGDPNACATLGEYLESGSGTNASAEGAVHFYELACARGHEDGCVGAARLLLVGGVGLAPDPAKGVRILKRGCDDGQPKLCTALATVHAFGRGVPQDYVSAVTYFEKACSLGEDGSCMALANLYKEGKGTPVNMPRAFSLFKRSCDAELMAACWMLGSMYEEGVGTQRDVRQAVALYRRACTGGANEACNAAERIREDR